MRRDFRLLPPAPPGFSVREIGAYRGHAVGHGERRTAAKPLENPNMNGPVLVLVKDGKPVNAKGRVLLEMHRNKPN